ncbi:MAG: phosphotransferase [Syntrophobacteraceae bacterium]
MKTEFRESTGMDVLLAQAQAISGCTGGRGIVPLAGDGSDRKFYRIKTDNTSFVALISPRTRGDSVDENDSYFAIGRHLRERRIPVPKILFSDPQSGLFLLEDVGDLHLQAFALRNRRSLENIYRRVLHLLACFHHKVPDGFSPDFCFDTALYDQRFIFERELEYFRKSFLVGYLGLEIDEELLRSDFENLAEAAGVTDMRHVFHRDFQSRNVMVHQNGLRVIDFQGMRFGPPAYDLASLLLDPYVKLPARLQETLAGLYWSAAGRFIGCSQGRFLKTYTAVRLCRNLQILGAFGFLGIVKGKAQFLQYIPWAWVQLREWLFNRCGGKYPELEKLVIRIESARLVGRVKTW